jgi:hypothetical protein
MSLCFDVHAIAVSNDKWMLGYQDDGAIELQQLARPPLCAGIAAVIGSLVERACLDRSVLGLVPY